ncbi:TVP38/TMEM64 family protein [Ornithinimicrobium sp. INDO-MA30-4]|uniref:TVP38/TMEM64 family protein n=1 Tax=Ornithinimicrobium sp. INDO-MA30-4 TaxID=2908651 RepID=UPI0037C676A7
MTAILTLRLIPIVPFTAINYGAGLSSVRFRDYFFGSALGMIPGSIAYVAVGAYASTNLWIVGGATTALVLMVVGGAFYGRRYARKLPNP